MKKTNFTRFVIFPFAMLVLLSSSLRAQCPALTTNLLSDPSFETSIGWNFFGAAYIAPGVFPAIDGVNSGMTEGQFFPGVSGMFSDAVVAPGDEVQASGFLRHNECNPLLGDDFSFISIEFYNAAGVQLANFPSNSLDASSPRECWQYLSVTATAPAGTAFARIVGLQIHFGLSGGVNYENFYLGPVADDMALVDVTPPVVSFGSPGANLLSNPGFEDGLNGWTLVEPIPNENPLNVTSDKLTANGGTEYVGLQGSFLYPINSTNAVKSDAFPAAPGETWKASGHMNHQGITSDNFGTVGIEFLDGAGVVISSLQSGQHNKSNAADTWERYEISGVAPAGTVQARFCFNGNQVGCGVGFINFDDATLMKIDSLASDPLVINLGAGECPSSFLNFDFCASDETELVSVVKRVVGTTDDLGSTFLYGNNTYEIVAEDACGNITVSAPFTIEFNAFTNASTSLTCNDKIQVSLDDDGCTLIGADMILEGGPYGCYDDYVLSRSPNHSGGCGALPATGYTWAECSDIGRGDVIVTVTDPATGNSCWGKVVVEDKIGPKVDCCISLFDKAGNLIDRGDVIDIDCSIDPATVPGPTATDNCDPSPFVSLANEEITGGNCNVLTIKRSYNTTDIYGNAGESCMITINVVQPDVTFPDDVTWTCQQYNAYANVVDATAMHPLIIANAASMDQSLLCCIAGLDGDDVAGVDPYGPGAYWMDTEDLDVTLDPIYDDNVDNPITDGNGACGNATAETDELECVANFGYFVGCPYLQDCDIAPPTAHAPQIIQVPIFQPPLAPPFPPNDIKRGLEDADVLELTGSGEPNVVGLNCNFSVTHTDHRLEACEGLGTDGSVFKILRTWQVLNWCTGQVFTDIQIIKVLDRKAPTITFGDDYNDELVSNVPSSGAHPDCRSNGLIDVPTFADDCSGVGVVSVSTPFGSATPVENNGVVVGYRVGAPFLPMGTHTIVFTVEDACGNRTTANRQITVIDGIPPVPVCRELTQVALGGEPNGVTSVGAEFFDEGSYDYCSSVFFKVRRMERFECDKANIDTHGEIGNTTNANDDQEWFDDKVKFCCEDIGNDVTVILRVYDVDPGPGEINTNQAAANGFTHRNGSRGDAGNRISYNDAFLNGTYNDCMIQVTLEDKVRPTCIAPADVWLNCNDLPDNVDYEDTDQLNDLFGSAIAGDNCNAAIEDLNPNVQVDLCGVGQIIRDYRAVDDFGNRSIGRCRQTIMIMAQNDYTLLVPGDFEEECDDATPRDFEYEERACDLFAINFEDREFPASTNGECKKIIRSWQLINWCEYDGASNALVLPRLDLNLDGEAGDGEGGSNNPVTGVRHAATHQWVSNGDIMILNMNPANTLPSTGYYSYEQHIKIFDNTAPDVSYNGPTDFCGGDLNNDPCDGQVDIAPVIDDLCTATTHRWELSAFSSTFGNADFSGTGDFSGRYPLGVHTVRFYVEDECGNISQLDITFEITDCKLPTPVCHNGLSIDIMPLAKMVELWASDFDASSFDYCTDQDDLQFRVNRVTDRNNDGVITPDDYITRVPAFDSVQFVCSDVGLLVNIQFWVGDAAGNWDYCVTYVDVQDNNNACAGSRPASIAGSTKTETGVGVANVDVTISGDMNNMLTTANDGNFAFNNLIEGNDYTVTPMRNDDIDNGVSTYDLALISKHVRNVELLNSPYKMIAADANNSGNISTLDLVAIRKVILFVAAEFPNNTSWRFVSKDQILNPTNPFNAPIIEAGNFNNIVGDELADFIAVKVGDVSGNAEPQNVNTIDDRTFNGTFFFNANDVAFEAGEEVVVEFTSEQLAEIEGYQFTMNFDNKALSLVEIQEATANQENFGQTMVDKGILTASWNGTAQSEVAFKLVFNAINAGKLSQALSISSEYTQAEAYTTGGQLQNVGIDFGTTSSTADFALYQNTPNPFKGETMIGFNLPEAAAATITVSDVSGKVIKIVSGDYAQGYNQVTLNSSELANGVLYYQLDTDNYTATKKMIIIE